LADLAVGGGNQSTRGSRGEEVDPGAQATTTRKVPFPVEHIRRFRMVPRHSRAGISRCGSVDTFVVEEQTLLR